MKKLSYLNKQNSIKTLGFRLQTKEKVTPASCVYKNCDKILLKSVFERNEYDNKLDTIDKFKYILEYNNYNSLLGLLNP